MTTLKKIAFLFLIIISNNAFGEMIPCIIIKNNGDTLKASLKISDFRMGDFTCMSMQTRIKYFDGTGKKHKLQPHEVRELIFDYESYHYRLLSRPYKNIGVFEIRFTSEPNVMMELILDGKVKIFRYHYMQQAGQSSYQTSKYLFQKTGQDFFEPGIFTFKKDLISYLADCPNLTEKIKNKEYKRNDIFELIEYYNSHCSQ